MKQRWPAVALILTIVLLESILAGGVPAQSQNAAPTARCGFPGFAPTLPLAETTRATDGWVLCPPRTGCRPSPLKAREPVVIYSSDNNWTCAALPGGPGWVSADALRAVPIDPSPRLEAWLGAFDADAGRVTIRPARTPGALTLSGRGIWHGNNGVVHSGRFLGDASPQGNRMHFSDGSCQIDMALVGRYILADDNNNCGGLNVRFWGIWKRVPPPANKSAR